MPTTTSRGPRLTHGRERGNVDSGRPSSGRARRGADRGRGVPEAGGGPLGLPLAQAGPIPLTLTPSTPTVPATRSGRPAGPRPRPESKSENSANEASSKQRARDIKQQEVSSNQPAALKAPNARRAQSTRQSRARQASGRQYRPKPRHQPKQHDTLRTLRSTRCTGRFRRPSAAWSE